MALAGILKRSNGALQGLQSANGNSVEKNMVPEDSTLCSIRSALTRWREHWVNLRSHVSDEKWASMGFYKNGYSFWLVSQLLLTKKDAINVIMQMEVKCEDKLEKLKVLLADEQD